MKAPLVPLQASMKLRTNSRPINLRNITYLKQHCHLVPTEPENFLHIPGNRMMLWGFAIWVEVGEYIEKFRVFDNREWAVAIGDPQCDFHAVGRFGILGPRGVGCEGTGLCRVSGRAVAYMTSQITCALIMPRPRNRDRGVAMVCN